MPTLSLRCKCGALRGAAHTLSPQTGLRFVCHCADCQAYAQFLKRPDDILDAAGGTDIFTVTPSQLEITLGHENLACVRLSDKGMYRWHTDCCQTPIANTMANSKFPYAGVVHSIMDYAASGTKRDEALGPIRARVQGKSAKAPLPVGTHSTMPLSLLFSILKFVARGFWKKQSQPSPFFQPSGNPRVKPRILTKDERHALSAERNAEL